MEMLVFLLLVLGQSLCKSHGAPTAVSCTEQIPPQLILDLWSKTTLLISHLPNVNGTKGNRLLPKFCIHCKERVIGWSELSLLVGVYQRSVFASKPVRSMLPKHYPELLHRLQHTLTLCVSSPESKWSKSIKKVERKIKKMSRGGEKRRGGVFKAVGEFKFILRWIDELREQNV